MGIPSKFEDRKNYGACDAMKRHPRDCEEFGEDLGYQVCFHCHTYSLLVWESKTVFISNYWTGADYTLHLEGQGDRFSASTPHTPSVPHPFPSMPDKFS